MSSRAAALLCLLVWGLVAAGCSTMPRLISSDDLEARDRRILELEREVQRARGEAASLRQRVDELERAADLAARSATSEAPPPAAPIAAPVAEPSPAPVAPRIAVEESDLVDAGGGGGGGAAVEGSARYDAALTALAAGRFDEAERDLLSFAESSPGSDLADNAWFWLGESKAARGDAGGAIDAYRTAIDRYPEGNKIPDALLKLGVALEASGQTAAARESWTELVRRFPTTAAADAASLRLEAP